MDEKAEDIDEIIKTIGRKYGAFCAYKIIKQVGDSEVLQIAFIMRDDNEKPDFHKIFSELSEKLKSTNIDLVILNTAPLAIAYIILKKGEEVYCDDRALLKRFAAKVVEKYLDFRNEVRGHTEISLKKTKLS